MDSDINENKRLVDQIFETAYVSSYEAKYIQGAIVVTRIVFSFASRYKYTYFPINDSGTISLEAHDL